MRKLIRKIILWALKEDLTKPDTMPNWVINRFKNNERFCVETRKLTEELQRYCDQLKKRLDEESKNTEKYFSDTEYSFRKLKREVLNILKEIKTENEHVKKIIENTGVSVDVHDHNRFANSWAVISLQGKNKDFIKFVDLGDRELREISSFLRQFERRTVDASPMSSDFLKFDKAGRTKH